MNLEEFYRGKKVFVTGHTGIKGSWMCKVLLQLGADITGYSLDLPTNPSLFGLLSMEKYTNTIFGDIRDMEALQNAMDRSRPEIVIHLAAQPIVRESYSNPVYTYGTNVMGTVNLLECIRKSDSVKSVVNVTTDKVYRNNEWQWGYRENDILGGYDPYSNSKSCSELVTESYKRSFFDQGSIAVSTARAGNVICGGDFARDRIIPDCVRAIMGDGIIVVRNPYSTRPYQHVLEPIFAYLMIAALQYDDCSVADSYNVGPEDMDCLTTGELVALFCKIWGNRTGRELRYESRHDGGPHEANFLKLDCSKIMSGIGWQPVWDAKTAIEKVVEWTDVWLSDGDFAKVMERQIREYEKIINARGKSIG